MPEETFIMHASAVETIIIYKYPIMQMKLPILSLYAYIINYHKFMQTMLEEYLSIILWLLRSGYPTKCAMCTVTNLYIDLCVS